MDILQNLKIFTMPTWLKAAVIVLLATLGAINSTIFFAGLLHESRESWVKASVELMSVILPVFIIGIIAWGSDTGTVALEKRAEDFFLNLLPDILSRTAETPVSFIETQRPSRHETGLLKILPRSSSTISPPVRAQDELSIVLVNFRRGDCYADFIMFVPDTSKENFTRIIFRVELNVRKVNVALCFDADLVLKKLGCDETILREDDLFKALSQILTHTFNGAAHQENSRDASPEKEEGRSEKKTKSPLSYRFNERATKKEVKGIPVFCVVASAWLPDEFLWNASERLFFAQDLLFFLRSALGEGRNLFHEYPYEDITKEVNKTIG
jgi:hypothetical protein